VIELDADLPPLRSPVVLAAFEGWNDAGDASTGAIDHLAEVWSATPIGAIDPDDYYDFQVNRPTVALVDGKQRRISWPTSRLSICSPPDGDQDLVLLRGVEPNMRWRAFCAELIGAFTELGVQTVITLGALLADAPHTRPVQVTGTAQDAATAERLGLTRSRYEGPTGIVGVFHQACDEADMTALSFWAAVPHYVAQPPCPKATLALLRRVEDLLDLAIPLGALPEESRAWEERVDELAREDSDVMEYVRTLEARESTEDLPEASGDAIAREFERYLRRRDADS
jgi:proteasome assembly chaperone (PAC2) family protein